MSLSIRMFLVVFAILITGGAGEVAKSDDLLSEVTISSVFADASDADTIKRPKTGRRLTGSHSVRRVLTEAGFVPQDLVDDVVAVDADTLAADEETLKVAVVVSEDRETLLLTVALAKVAKDRTASNELQTLLKKRQAKDAVYYEFTSGWLRARLRIPNQHVSANWLKTQIAELVETVEEDVSVWSNLGKSFEQVVTDNVQAETLKKMDLEGTWTATDQGTRYGLRFDGTKFRLGIVVNGKLTKSEGTWSVSDGNLTLKGERTSLGATVNVISQDRLDLKFGTRLSLEFQRK